MNRRSKGASDARTRKPCASSGGDKVPSKAGNQYAIKPVADEMREPWDSESSSALEGTEVPAVDEGEQVVEIVSVEQDDEEMTEPTDDGFVVEFREDVTQIKREIDELPAQMEKPAAEEEGEIVIQIVSTDGEIVTANHDDDVLQTILIENVEQQSTACVVEDDEGVRKQRRDGGAVVTTEEEDTVSVGVAYRCPACSRIFHKHNAFYGHLRSHKGVVFRCDRDRVSCQQEFTSLAALRKHHKEDHDNVKEFKCVDCTKSYDDQTQLDLHVECVHKANRPFACRLCPKAFLKRADLKQHLRLHLGIKKNACNVCRRAFAHVSNLYRHMKVHGKEGEYICGECGQTFLRIGGLNQHMRSHEKEGMTHLNDDNIEEVEKQMLLSEEEEEEEVEADDQRLVIKKEPDDDPEAVKEQRVDAEDDRETEKEGKRKKKKRYSCRRCKETFSSEVFAKDHLRTVHTIADKEFMCKKCLELFDNETDCRLHLHVVHLNKQKLLVGGGGKSAVADDNDDVAAATATAAFKYPVKVVKKQPPSRTKKFKSSWSRFTCKVCRKRCKNGSSLNLHLKGHDKYGQLICYWCRRDCRKLDILSEHDCTGRTDRKVLAMRQPSDLEDYVRKVIKVPARSVPTEILIRLSHHLLAHFTRPLTQMLVEKLRAYATVKLDVKTQSEMDGEQGSEVTDSEEDDDDDDEEEGEPSLEDLEEFARRRLQPKTASTFMLKAATRSVDKGDDSSLDLFMDYIPDKTAQERRLRAFSRPFLPQKHHREAEEEEEEQIVIQSVPLDKPESIIQVQALPVVPPGGGGAAVAERNGKGNSRQFFKVVNMPVVVDEDQNTMLTITTADGDNWIVTSNDGDDVKKSDWEEEEDVKPSKTIDVVLPDRPSVKGFKRKAPPTAPIIINEPVTFPLEKKIRVANSGFEIITDDEENRKKLQEFFAESQSGKVDVVVKNGDEEKDPSEDCETPAVDVKSLKRGKSGKYECKKCGNDFTRPESLFQHMGMHDESMAVKCDQCDEKFAWKSTLKKHILTVHEGKVLSVPCGQCDRVFKSFGHRKVHIARDHNKERNHECEECGKRFFLKDDLKTHSRIHTGLKPYSCAICRKTFKHVSHRNRHQKTSHEDSDGKPYNCELCKKGFSGKAHLVTHFRRHHHDMGAHQVDTLLGVMLKS